MEEEPALIDAISQTASTKATGTLGEAEAADYLTSRGYRIIDTNVRPIGGRKRGEIDVVAWFGEYLVFVEVKTRRASAASTISPSEAVDWRKRRQLLSLAQAYITRYNLDEVACRFDVVEVIRRNGVPVFNLIVNAFDGNDV